MYGIIPELKGFFCSCHAILKVNKWCSFCQFVKGHFGKDKRFYLVDTARLFPPATPIRGVRGSFLTNLLRLGILSIDNWIVIKPFFSFTHKFLIWLDQNLSKLTLFHYVQTVLADSDLKTDKNIIKRYDLS